MAHNIYMQNHNSLLGSLSGQAGALGITATGVSLIGGGGGGMGISSAGSMSMHPIQPDVKLSELVLEYICMHGHAPVKYDAFKNKDFIRLPKDVLHCNPETEEFQITEYGIEIAKISTPKT